MLLAPKLSGCREMLDIITTQPSIMRMIRSIISFYKSFSNGSLIITGLCLGILYKWGSSTLTALIWFKFISLSIFLFHINSSKKDDFYYYKNLGISKRTLWIGAILFDMCLFIVSIIIMLKLR